MSAPTPTLSSRGVSLRPLVDTDFEHLRIAEFLTLEGRWRTRGSTPSVADYPAVVSAGVFVQLLAIADGEGLGAEPQLVGWYQAYNVEVENGIAWIGMASFAEGGAPTFAVGGALFVDYCFSMWPLRKLYLEVPSYSEGVLASAIGGLLTSEGRLRGRTFYMGEYVDVGIYSIDRTAWQEGQLRDFVAP